MKTIDKILKYATPIILILVLFRTCGIGSDQKRIKDSLVRIENNMVSDSEMNIKLSEFMWRTLELEEMSDKNKIPINQLKNERKEHIIIE